MLDPVLFCHIFYKANCKPNSNGSEIPIRPAKGFEKNQESRGVAGCPLAGTLHFKYRVLFKSWDPLGTLTAEHGIDIACDTVGRCALHVLRQVCLLHVVLL